MKGYVALVKGPDREQNITQALEAIADDLDVTAARRVTIKPNFVSVRRPLCATHRDAVAAVLAFLDRRGVRDVSLVAGPAMGTAAQAMHNYGYESLIAQYGLRVVDLNDDVGVEVELWDRHLKPLRLPVARTLLESDLRISVGSPKTHDLVMATLSLKNMAVGALLRPKSRIHQNCQAVHLNLYHMAFHVAPHLAIIDGYQDMEGDGPVSGDAVDWGIAVASTDFCAADTLTASLMGFAEGEIGYLHYCALKGLGEGRLDKMRIVGNVEPATVRRSFKRHRDFASQTGWRIKDVDRYL